MGVGVEFYFTWQPLSRRVRRQQIWPIQCGNKISVLAISWLRPNVGPHQERHKRSATRSAYALSAWKRRLHARGRKGASGARGAVYKPCRQWVAAGSASRGASRLYSVTCGAADRSAADAAASARVNPTLAYNIICEFPISTKIFKKILTLK